MPTADLPADLPTQLDPQTALIIIDLQEFVRGLPYTHPIAKVAARAGELASAFRARQLPVITTLVSGGVMPRADRRMQLPAGIPAAQMELMQELQPADTDLKLPKKHWGAFTDTDLQQYLTERRVTQVVIAGVATGFGVESTARHASELGYNVTIALDAVTDMNAQVHECATQFIFPAMSEVRTVAEIVAALEGKN